MLNKINLFRCFKFISKKILHTGIFNNLPDKVYLSLFYRIKVGQKLNLINPTTFNEKIQWLKLYDRKEEYTEMVDKYLSKKYVERIIGNQYIIPTIGVWDNFDEIDFEKLPNKFVLKTTHDSGGIIICKDKKNFNKKNARIQINKSLKRNFYYFGREWPYKNVKPRIICEPFMREDDGSDLKDYKIFCFDGVPRMIQVDYDRFTNHKRNLYTCEWEFINAKIKYPNDRGYIIEKPLNLDEMLDLATKLSNGIPHVRVDFYNINNHIYFGELTFYHETGLAKFEPEEFGYELGKFIKI